MIYLITTYLLYVWCTFLLIVVVGHSLYKNGEVFLVEAFGNRELAESINKLLLAGYYLTNCAYVLLLIAESNTPTNAAQVIEMVSTKVGFITIALALMHYFNLLVFSSWKYLKRRFQRLSGNETIKE